MYIHRLWTRSNWIEWNYARVSVRHEQRNRIRPLRSIHTDWIRCFFLVILYAVTGIALTHTKVDTTGDAGSVQFIIIMNIVVSMPQGEDDSSKCACDMRAPCEGEMLLVNGDGEIFGSVSDWRTHDWNDCVSCERRQCEYVHWKCVWLWATGWL